MFICKYTPYALKQVTLKRFIKYDIQGVFLKCADNFTYEIV
jgi:hypothetical protein